MQSGVVLKKRLYRKSLLCSVEFQLCICKLLACLVARERQCRKH